MRDIDLIAGLITEDPDYSADSNTVLLEWFWNKNRQAQDPVSQRLSMLIDKRQVKDYVNAMGVPADQALQQAMEGLVQEYQKFKRNYRLSDDQKALAAFEEYKKTKRLPEYLSRDPAELDQIGGSDFRPG